MHIIKNNPKRALLIGLSSVAVIVALLAATFTLLPGASAASVTIHSRPISVNPLRQPAGTPTNAVFGCQTNRGPNALVCYGPQQIWQAYNLNPLYNAGINGAGRTIVIIDAFQNPYIQTDLAAFDQVFGLPDPVFHQDAPDGLTPFDFNDANMVGWAGEISLDVQWAHAIAPAAKIELVLAKSNQDEDILRATKWAIEHNVGDVISQSFGENENCVDSNLLKQEHAIFQAAVNKGITLFASSGDEGSAQLTCDGNSWTQVASSPASDPLVTAVGGTELFAAFDCRGGCPEGSPVPGTYDHEITMNEPAGFLTQGSFATGGGFSDIYGRPGYQKGVANTRDGKRGVPDVAYDGTINHGVVASCAACVGVNAPAFFIFGGTSSGSPQWAALTALADQQAGKRLGQINEALYKIGQNPAWYASAFHDITVGDNAVTEFDAANNPVDVPGFDALTGWDAATGWGSPNGANLIALLVSIKGTAH